MVWQISATVVRSSFARVRSCSILRGLRALGLPKSRPRAACRPAWVPSRMRSRLNWASAPKTWKISLPLHGGQSPGRHLGGGSGAPQGRWGG